ncbi:MAG TPA: hypothetical protein VE912_13385 [Bacteroidales bacterium]|nr:hypothetical protein [Bacteroidales bacterium]
MENKKITVKHYLNKRAKPKTYHKDRFYPLYIQIIVTGKKAQIKSKINEHLKIYRSDIERFTKNDDELNKLILAGYLSDKLLDKIIKNKIFPIYHLLIDEVNIIKRIIRFYKPFEDENFTLSNFSNEYKKHTTEITNILDNKIKEMYQTELKSLFLKSIDQDENRDVFKISNYFIHFINWENSFSNFYETTYEIIPSELKLIENLLSNELRTSIKAFMAYHSKVNILKRFFEKRELGRISTLSYLDWETDIKEFVTKEFEKIFGEQKSLQFVISLDNILVRNIREE